MIPPEIIPLILPIVIIDIALKLFALYRLSKDEVASLSKPVWALIILIVSTIGPIIFLIFGRKKE